MAIWECSSIIPGVIFLPKQSISVIVTLFLLPNSFSRSKLFPTAIIFPLCMSSEVLYKIPSGSFVQRVAFFSKNASVLGRLSKPYDIFGKYIFPNSLYSLFFFSSGFILLFPSAIFLMALHLISFPSGINPLPSQILLSEFMFPLSLTIPLATFKSGLKLISINSSTTLIVTLLLVVSFLSAFIISPSQPSSVLFTEIFI